MSAKSEYVRQCQSAWEQALGASRATQNILRTFPLGSLAGEPTSENAVLAHYINHIAEELERAAGDLKRLVELEGYIVRPPSGRRGSSAEGQERGDG
jgi:hypothetical protein